jgi:hypothetical protein
VYTLLLLSPFWRAVEKVLVHESLVANGGLSKIQSALKDASVQVRHSSSSGSNSSGSNSQQQ